MDCEDEEEEEEEEDCKMRCILPRFKVQVLFKNSILDWAEGRVQAPRSLRCVLHVRQLVLSSGTTLASVSW